MRKHLKGIIIGFLISTLMFASIMTVVASLPAIEWRKIDVAYGDYKIYVDGEKFEATDKDGVIESFSYNGWIFAPFEHIARAIGMNARWDGTTRSLYLDTPATPKPPAPKVSLLEVATPTIVGRYTAPNKPEIRDSVVMAMNGTSYPGAIVFIRTNDSFSNYGGSDSTKHNLNGKYKKLTGTLGRVEGSIQGNATFAFYGDRKLIETFNVAARDNPMQISIDITEIIELEIRVTYDPAGFTNALLYAFAGTAVE